jgi:hypothetical protein
MVWLRSWAPFPCLLIRLPKAFSRFDIALLSLLSAATQQDNQLRPVLTEINHPLLEIVWVVCDHPDGNFQVAK